MTVLEIARVDRVSQTYTLSADAPAADAALAAAQTAPLAAPVAVQPGAVF